MAHLRLGVEGKRDAAAAEAAEEVAEEVELQEPVQEHRGDGERREGVARPRHQRRRAEKQLPADSPALKESTASISLGWGIDTERLSPIEEVDLAAALRLGKRWADRQTREPFRRR